MSFEFSEVDLAMGIVAKRGLWGTCMAQVVATCKAGDAGLSHEPGGMVRES